jgi:hypothetical protein
MLSCTPRSQHHQWTHTEAAECSSSPRYGFLYNPCLFCSPVFCWLLNAILPSDYLTTILYAFLVSSVLATFPPFLTGLMTVSNTCYCGQVHVTQFEFPLTDVTTSGDLTVKFVWQIVNLRGFALLVSRQCLVERSKFRNFCMAHRQT